jgi:aspartate ammonia-lyase
VNPVKYRIEKDSLGEKKVPADVYYGIQTQRAVENYPISGYRAHPKLICAIGMIKKAAALANRELELVDEQRAGAIAQAADEVITGKLNDQFVVDVYQAGAGVSFHMNTNEVVCNRAIEILGGKRGDYSVVHPNLVPEMRLLASELSKKGKEFDNILKSGRTHMMDAVPVRLGQEFAAYGFAVLRAADEIRHGQDRLRELGLGGTAVGTGVNTHPRYQALVVEKLSDASGQPLTATSDMRWTMQSNLPMAVASSALRNYALELIRISNDFRLLSSGPNTGMAEIVLPALQPGSSIMPGKINPVLPELVAMVSFQAVGADTATAMAVQGGQLELNVMMPAMAWNVLHSSEILKNTTHEFATRCVAGVTANRDRCKRYAESTVSLATALNPYIGYAKAAELAKRAVKTGRTITELAMEKKLLDQKQLRKILDPRRMTEPAPPIKEAVKEKPKKKAATARPAARKKAAPAKAASKRKPTARGKKAARPAPRKRKRKKKK